MKSMSISISIVISLFTHIFLLQIKVKMCTFFAESLLHFENIHTYLVELLYPDSEYIPKIYCVSNF